MMPYLTASPEKRRLLARKVFRELTGKPTRGELHFVSQAIPTWSALRAAPDKAWAALANCMRAEVKAFHALEQASGLVLNPNIAIRLKRLSEWAADRSMTYGNCPSFLPYDLK